MNIDRLRIQFPDEDACRLFFESIFWKNGRICPHCFNEKSYCLSGASAQKRFTNAAVAKAILPLQPNRPCTVPSCPCGNGCWPCT